MLYIYIYMSSYNNYIFCSEHIIQNFSHSMTYLQDCSILIQTSTVNLLTKYIIFQYMYMQNVYYQFT